MMISDPRFDVNPTEPAQPPERRSKWATCLIGCLVVVAVLALIAILLGVWVGRNWRGFAANVADEMLTQGIESADLAPEQKQNLRAQVRRVTDGVRNGQITRQQLVRLANGVSHSPLMTFFVVTVLERQYLDKSGLSADEKTAGKQALQRFVRGAADGKINEQGVDSVMGHVGERDRNGNWRMRERVTDEELRAALREAKAQADAADIPEQPESFDPSEELKRIIDEALAPAA